MTMCCTSAIVPVTFEAGIAKARRMSEGKDVRAAVAALPASLMNLRRSESGIEDLMMIQSDLDRIEMLRGPKDKPCGSGSMDGLINFVTIGPPPSRLSHRAAGRAVERFSAI